MAIEKITMPQLGESVTEGTISTWLVKPGDKVNKYDPVAEVMTDKVNAEVPSSYSGIIKKLIANEGDTLAVGDIMCEVEIEAASTSETAPASVNAQQEATSNKNQETVSSEADQSMKKRYSPAVMRLAQENDIDLNQVKGTGKGGRITRKDVEKFLASPQADKSIQATAPKQASQTPSSLSRTEIATYANTSIAAEDVEIPVTGVRKVIAQNMVKSKTEIPHAWMTVEVDVTDLVSYRDKVKTDFKQKEGFNLTYFAFFVKAVAQALKKYPQLNSMWAGDKIIQKKDINISIAVANEDQLFVPVIKHADDKSMKGIAKEINGLAAKARSNKLTADDMQGGTFTVNNTGSFGSIHSMGVINHPQAAILQVESIVKRPVIIDGMFAARDMVNLSLSLDHRILDGLVCGRFLAYVKEILESMNEESTSIY